MKNEWRDISHKQAAMLSETERLKKKKKKKREEEEAEEEEEEEFVVCKRLENAHNNIPFDE